MVSILIRPFDRMLPDRAVSEEVGLGVSILIRPFDRMLHGDPTELQRHMDVSILIRPFDRMLQEQFAKGLNQEVVSILIRPFARMLPPAARIAAKVRKFQSSSGPSTGCCFQWAGSGPRFPGFNPHPALRPDAAPDEPAGR